MNGLIEELVGFGLLRLVRCMAWFGDSGDSGLVWSGMVWYGPVWSALACGDVRRELVDCGLSFVGVVLFRGLLSHISKGK